jgi:adenylate cyclase
MPYIHVRNTGEKIETNLVTSILVSLQLNHVRIHTVCGGRAKCGKCAIRIVRGSEYLTRKRELEIKRLQMIKAEAEEQTRLACQTYTRGDIEIEILNIDE